MIKVLSEKNEVLRPKQRYKPYVKNELNKVAKHIMINKHLKVENGILVFWKTNGIFVPYFFLIEFLRNLENDYSGLFSDVAYVQSKAAADMQRQIFGLKNTDALFSNLVDQLDITGYGSAEYVLEDNGVNYTIIHNFVEDFSGFYSIEDLRTPLNYFLYLMRGIHDFAYGSETELKLDGNKCYLKFTGGEPSLSDDQKNIEKELNSRVLVMKASLR